MNSRRWLLLSGLSLSLLAGCDIFFPPGQSADQKLKAAVLRWNRIAIDASGLDHTPLKAGENRTFGHQLGPTRSSRAIAIVHIALFEAVNAVEGGFQSYVGLTPATADTSVLAAVAQASHDALVAMFPSHAPNFDAKLAEDLAACDCDSGKQNGILIGQQAAAAILAMRAGDHSDESVNYVVSDQPGAWRPDPINPTQQPLGEEWPNVTPFVLTSGSQFRVPPPPAMDSAEYTAAFNEVKDLGGDGIVTPTSRTAEQGLIGIYWAYDGTPSLCAPPRLYNQIATQLADERNVNGVNTARLLALVNVAMADAGIAIWDSKFFYNFWRPVTGIREADVGAGPSGLGDGNSNTVGDATYVPLCAPATNLTAPNFTPPFPAYPSGHAGFGGSLFETLRDFFGTDDISFTFVSDELNGATLDNQGNVRPLFPRSFTSLSQAEEENGQSRIYLGIHWKFDKVEGIAQGRQVADFVAQNIFQPVP